MSDELVSGRIRVVRSDTVHPKKNPLVSDQSGFVRGMTDFWTVWWDSSNQIMPRVMYCSSSQTLYNSFISNSCIFSQLLNRPYSLRFAPLQQSDFLYLCVFWFVIKVSRIEGSSLRIKLPSDHYDLDINPKSDLNLGLLLVFTNLMCVCICFICNFCY